jgi:hypothetical protein
MEKTLQQQYNLIKEGKGDKQYFLKQARHLFPEYITSLNDFNTAVHILRDKSILNENAGGVITTGRKDWWAIFDTNLAEAVGVKDKKEYGDQNAFDKIDKDVQKVLDDANYNNKDPKNIDNLYGQSFLLGYLTEMSDPKNAKKTVDELKAIVAKNMAKDINYYHINASFGVKGIGYTKDSVGMGEPVAPKGKYKSSGYGDIKLKESIERKSLIELMSEEENLNEDETIDEGALDDQIAAAEKIVAQKKKESADAEKKAADLKAKEASAEAAG